MGGCLAGSSLLVPSCCLCLNLSCYYGCEFQTALAHESDRLAQENVAMRAFMVRRNVGLQRYRPRLASRKLTRSVLATTPQLGRKQEYWHISIICRNKGQEKPSRAKIYVMF